MGIEVRRVGASQDRSAYDLFRAAVHRAPLTDEQWAPTSASVESGRTLGAFDGDLLVGAAASSAGTLAVPGGDAVSAALVTRVAVRPDRTRRGVLTMLMREQLAAVADAGEVATVLRATEPVIYSRFGYGPATQVQRMAVRAPHTQLRPEVPADDRVRVIDFAELGRVLPEVYRRLAARPGMLSRSDGWWRHMLANPMGEHQVCVVHTGPDGDDGFVIYQATRLRTFDEPEIGVALEVYDFHAAGPVAANSLWRYLLGVDLVAEVRVWERPADEPVADMLTDPRAVRDSLLRDSLWLRPVDVPALLAARAYAGAGPVTIELRDRLLPANEGTYLVGDKGIGRFDGPGELRMDVGTLAMIYLGARTPSVLAGIGRVVALDPAALGRADRLFATDAAPWCGTFF